MVDFDHAYYERRAQAELELAERATHEAAARAHYELASAYLDMMESVRGRPGDGAGEN